MYRLEIRNIRRADSKVGQYNFIFGELWRIPTFQNVDGKAEMIKEGTIKYLAESIEGNFNVYQGEFQ